MHSVLMLGGYGFFGGRISRALAKVAGIRLLIAGRDIERAKMEACRCGLPEEQGVFIDAAADDLAGSLRQLHIDTVIHTAGPFQGQDYKVARAAIVAGANYIDLADGRKFVCGISQLDEEARRRGVLVTSGASSLPALSSAVVDRYSSRFKQLKTIRHGIGSGAKAPGLATMKGVFGYCGKPFNRLSEGEQETTYGWLGLQCYEFPTPVGRRLLGSCDVPDLTLFPQRYPGIRTVSFHAGFAGTLGHLAVWLGAQLVRCGMLPSLAPLARPLHFVSHWLECFVSDKGGMFVTLEGIGHDDHPLNLTWHLLAANNHGPLIPCGAAIALTRKLAAKQPLPIGAMPCMGLLSVEEYLKELAEFNVQEVPA
jgi:saccharopine dehydrogenase-like NADP-dependent oxidoreductase